MMDGPQRGAGDTKEILHGAVHREKPLRVGRRCEPAHLTLPLPGRLVRDFGRLFAYPSVQSTTDGITVRQAAG